MKRVLSIDGGGIKGVFPAAFLTAIEEAIEGLVSDYFDLIAGTSTGGIIALGLGLGLSASEILGLYKRLGPDIFGRQNVIKRIMWLFRSKYNSDKLRKALEEQFRSRKLGESKTRLVIPSLDLNTGEVHIFKTSHHPRFEMDYKTRMVDVALATSAAPTFFPTFHTTKGVPLIDGGVWANNPTGMAVVEAIGVLGWSREEIHVLSLGCTDSPLAIAPSLLSRAGIGGWAKYLVDVFMTGQSFASLDTAYLLLDHERVHRISPITPTNKFQLDSVSGIEALEGFGYTEARKALPTLKETFFLTKAETFEPYHKL